MYIKKKMSDEELLNFKRNIMSKKDYLEKLSLLAQNEDFDMLVTKFEEKLNNNSDYDKYNLSEFNIYYSIFKGIVQFKKMLEKPNEYTLEERKNICSFAKEQIAFLEYYIRYCGGPVYNKTVSVCGKEISYARLHEAIEKTLGNEDYINAYKVLIKSIEVCIENLMIKAKPIKNNIDAWNILHDNDKYMFNLDIEKTLKSYANVKEKVKKLLEKSSYEKSLMELATYCIYVIKDFDIDRAYQIIYDAYFYSLVNDDKIKIYNDFSFEDICKFKSIKDNLNNTRYYQLNKYVEPFYVSKNEQDNIEEYEDEQTDIDIYDANDENENSQEKEITKEKDIYKKDINKKDVYRKETYKLYLIIKKFNKDNLNLFEKVYKLKTNYKYNLESYDKIMSIAIYYGKHYLYDDAEEYINQVKEILEYYQSIVYGTKGMYDAILSNDSKRDTNIEITYYFNYLKKKEPENVRVSLISVNSYIGNQDKVLEYALGYKKYYQEKIDEINARKQMEFEQKQKENLPKFEMIIKDFIASGEYSISNYCNKNVIEEKEFKYMVEILKKLDSPMYEEYTKYIESKQSQRFAIIVSKLNKMFEEMVKSNGKFTLLDYYEHTRLSLDETIKIMKDNITPSQRTIWAKFAIKYKNDKELDQYKIKQLLEDSNKIKYCIEMDNKGNVLNSYEVTRADKEQALLMLKEKKMPITNATFSLMVKKYYEESILPSLTNNKGKNI